MALNLTGVLGDAGNLLGSISGQDIAQNLVLGAGTTLILSGMGTAAGQNALDPLNWFHHTPPPTTAAPAPVPVTGVVQGKVMTMSQYLALSADNQKMIAAMGYTIIPGMISVTALLALIGLTPGIIALLGAPSLAGLAALSVADKVTLATTVIGLLPHDAVTRQRIGAILHAKKRLGGKPFEQVIHTRLCFQGAPSGQAARMCGE